MSIVSGHVIINKDGKYLTEDFIWTEVKDLNDVNLRAHVFTDSELMLVRVLREVKEELWELTPQKKQSATYDTAERKITLVGSPEEFESRTA